MATLGEDAFDYIYSPYNPYSYQYLSSRPKASSWRPRSYLNYGDPGEYFDNYQRAQLKAILSQVNPNLTPRVRKANTKDVGVQVNPKIDASVQCSLGPRTLMMMTTRQRRRPPPNQVQGSPASMPRNVRFRRTMAIYSPIVSPNLNSFVYRGEPREAGRQGPKEAPAKPQQEEKDEPEGVKQEDGVQEEPAPEQEQEPAPEQGPTPEEKGDEPTDCLALPAGELPEAPVENENEPEAGNAVTKTSKNEKRLRFQFLEQKYGYFHCKECNARWESAYVWCVQGTNKTCKQTRCTCPVKMRHVDPKRPHRQDLCGRCKGKRLSCDSTFSFKYII
ncbi:zygote arrest protein 1 isoform X2 [Rhincodon typus]|uniref:zygote arrest protein 1 isoform X2 n=1 Tax=Rhincodon typus TaxID=259920 RepID=UPI00202E21DD|nr:zygote arrest protein 1 isoform X2 [Rhincodon typus]